MDDLEFWECPRSHCRILKGNRVEFCAVRRERAKEGDLCFKCKGDYIMTAAAVKKCEGCGKEYQATSNHQKFCAECKPTKKAQAVKLKPPKVTPRRMKTNGHECAGCGEYAQVEKIMIAAGIVTAEKFEQAHQFVKGLDN